MKGVGQDPTTAECVTQLICHTDKVVKSPSVATKEKCTQAQQFVTVSQNSSCW